MTKTPNRDRAILMAAERVPKVGTRKGDTLHLDLRGHILAPRDPRPGIEWIAVAAALLRNPSASHVHVEIDSSGGSITDAERIYSALRRHKGHKTVNANHQCASAATIILMAGDFRTATPDTELLFHSPEIPAKDFGRWTQDKHELSARRLRKISARMVQIYATRTGRDARDFEEEISNEQLMSLPRARRLGVIHCLAGEERWINGRPHYFPAGELQALLESRAIAHRDLRQWILSTPGQFRGAFIGHAAFSRAAIAAWKRPGST